MCLNIQKDFRRVRLVQHDGLWRKHGKLWGVLCQKQISRIGMSIYVPQYVWNVITCPCLLNLLLAQQSWNVCVMCGHARLAYQRHCFIVFPVDGVRCHDLFTLDVTRPLSFEDEIKLKENPIHTSLSLKCVITGPDNGESLVWWHVVTWTQYFKQNRTLTFS